MLIEGPGTGSDAVRGGLDAVRSPGFSLQRPPDTDTWDWAGALGTWAGRWYDIEYTASDTAFEGSRLHITAIASRKDISGMYVAATGDDTIHRWLKVLGRHEGKEGDVFEPYYFLGTAHLLPGTTDRDG